MFGFTFQDEAMEFLALQFSMHYQTLTATLTSKQVSYLKALTRDEEKICSHSTLREYNLNTSANVARIKKSLKNKEIIETECENTFLLDPLYGTWLKNHYFRI